MRTNAPTGRSLANRLNAVLITMARLHAAVASDIVRRTDHAKVGDSSMRVCVRACVRMALPTTSHPKPFGVDQAPKWWPNRSALQAEMWCDFCTSAMLHELSRSTRSVWWESIANGGRSCVWAPFANMYRGPQVAVNMINVYSTSLSFLSVVVMMWFAVSHH